MAILLAGCAASPDIIVEKNITVTIEGAIQNHPSCPAPVVVSINYTTQSDFPVKADTKQDIRPKTTIPVSPQ